MRLNRQLLRRFTLGGSIAAMAITLSLVCGVSVSLAADYQDAHDNVCEGNSLVTPFCDWGGKLTPSAMENTAIRLWGAIFPHRRQI